MTQYRVSFDFTVHFTNGGFLSSEGFRLDIPGPQIGDDELAACLVKDMHLLMAGRVEIRNKRIIEEPHKRGVVDTSGLPRHTIDLSRETVALDDLLRLADSGSVRVVANGGESFLVSRLVG